MIVYFHLTKHPGKKGKAIPRLPWVSNLNRELLVARMRTEIDGHMNGIQKKETDFGGFYFRK
ncbi:hypothetical protein Ahy_A04g018965 [Arachis hypogaea]|uniref:Uncharacterized protein n=1 Tax=Arachis hypogaea TaxID=3818 RepID=A0A445DF11_ARAHY|nr:hypothetical protein Ahy_A04g018965 [Arachis hypogaea]